MIVIISAILGCVYALQDDALIVTPLDKDGSYDTQTENWDEVDHLALLGEEEYIRQEVDRCENILRAKFA